MSVDKFFLEGLKINPRVGKFVVGGLLVIAGAVIVVDWVGPEKWYATGPMIAQAVLAVFVVSALAACLVAWLPRAGGNSLQVAAFSWAMLVPIMVMPSMLATSLLFNWPTYLVCLQSPLQRCEDVLDNLRGQKIQESAASVRPVAADATRGPAVAVPAAGAVDRGRYKVMLDFSGSFNRDLDIKPLLSRLRGVGWTVPPSEDVKQRNAQTAGRAEVRYHAPGDKAAAERLAEDIKANLIFNKTITPVASADTAEGVLRIWIAK